MKLVKTILAHAVIILVVIYITLQIVEICNPHMGFLSNPFAVTIIWMLPIVSLLFSVISILCEDKNDQKKE